MSEEISEMLHGAIQDYKLAEMEEQVQIPSLADLLGGDVKTSFNPDVIHGNIGQTRTFNKNDNTGYWQAVSYIHYLLVLRAQQSMDANIETGTAEDNVPIYSRLHLNQQLQKFFNTKDATINYMTVVTDQQLRVLSDPVFKFCMPVTKDAFGKTRQELLDIFFKFKDNTCMAAQLKKNNALRMESDSKYLTYIRMQQPQQPNKANKELGAYLYEELERAFPHLAFKEQSVREQYLRQLKYYASKCEEHQKQVLKAQQAWSKKYVLWMDQRFEEMYVCANLFYGTILMDSALFKYQMKPRANFMDMKTDEEIRSATEGKDGKRDPSSYNFFRRVPTLTLRAGAFRFQLADHQLQLDHNVFAPQLQNLINFEDDIERFDKFAFGISLGGNFFPDFVQGLDQERFRANNVPIYEQCSAMRLLLITLDYYNDCKRDVSALLGPSYELARARFQNAARADKGWHPDCATDTIVPPFKPVHFVELDEEEEKVLASRMESQCALQMNDDESDLSEDEVMEKVTPRVPDAILNSTFAKKQLAGSKRKATNAQDEPTSPTAPKKKREQKAKTKKQQQ